jgi:hypothetical protein
VMLCVCVFIQVASRAQECRRVVDILEKLNSGEYVENVLGKDFKLAQFKV